jgi:hypothetical protein
MDTYKVTVMALCDYRQSGLHNKNVETRVSINNNWRQTLTGIWRDRLTRLLKANT